MINQICCFYGCSEIREEQYDDLQEKILMDLSSLIASGIVTFWVTTQNKFNKLCLNILREIKTSVKITIVLVDFKKNIIFNDKFLQINTFINDIIYCDCENNSDLFKYIFINSSCAVLNGKKNCNQKILSIIESSNLTIIET